MVKERIKADIEFDRYWKTQSVKIAMSEQLNLVEKLDLPNLFKRARIIYLEGYRTEMHKWHELMNIDLINNNLKESTEKKEVAQEQKTELKTTKNGTKKICPKCNEEIPMTWKRHTYKSNGDKCG